MVLRDFLDGIRVLDLSQYLPGPFATRMLADMGADVVKVEPPGGEPGRYFDAEGHPGDSPFWMVNNAAKTVITLDLKSDDGRAALATLIGAADILLESYRPGVLDRLGFGAEALQQMNPRLIHCALSGYGQTGPYKLASGHDINYESLTGGLDQCGVPERPVIPFPPMADYAGALQAVISVLGALQGRAHTGLGCFLDVSMAESLLFWNTLSFNAPMARGRGLLNGGAAFYRIYPTADGRFVSLSPLEPKFWDNFCAAVGRPDWQKRRYEPLPQDGLIAEVEALFASQPLAHWDTLLPVADCCYQAVLRLDEVPGHPQIEARGLIDRSGRWTDVLFPTLVDGGAAAPRRPADEVPVTDVLTRWAGATPPSDGSGDG
ncbi:MAG: CoA transferase [Defluviicoccus sp.]|nr:MAG: CoA transferase [Defluviicoccus sp.]